MQADFIAKRIIEGILFLSPNPLTIKDIAKVTGFKPSLISICLKELVDDYETRGVNVKAVAGAYQMITPADLAPYVEKFASYTKGISLSRPAMETLAIIAYRQPITRSEVEEVRGVNIDGVLNKLLDLKVVRIMGRSDKPGRPVLFGTSREFLRVFGMDSLNDLPKLDNAPVRESEKMSEVFNEDDEENNDVKITETAEAVDADTTEIAALTTTEGATPPETAEAVDADTTEIAALTTTEGDTSQETAEAVDADTTEIAALTTTEGATSPETAEAVDADTTEIVALTATEDDTPPETAEAVDADTTEIVALTATEDDTPPETAEAVDADTTEFPIVIREISEDNGVIAAYEEKN